MKELKNLNSLNNKKLLVVLPVNKINDLLLNGCVYSLTVQTNPIDLLVLINGLDEDQKTLLKSILDNPVTYIQEKNQDGTFSQKELKTDKKLNYVIEETESYQFQQVYNDAFNYASINNYSWISMVESEDVVASSWYNNFDLFSTEKTEYSGFFPLTRQFQKGNYTGFFNEACWSEGLAEFAGIFDLQLLLRFSCMNLTGAVLNVESVKQYSESIDGIYKPIKENIKISFIYEFFLRMIYNDLKFYSIPRVGYEHRYEMISDTTNPFSSKTPLDIINKSAELGGMTPDEYRFWSDIAKKEYFFDEARKVEYKKKELAIS